MAKMTVGKVSAALARSVALASTVLAGATIWLILTDPGAVAGALAGRPAERFLHGLIVVVVSAIECLLRWV
jgi:hypothetical protein